MSHKYSWGLTWCQPLLWVLEQKDLLPIHRGLSRLALVILNKYLIQIQLSNYKGVKGWKFRVLWKRDGGDPGKLSQERGSLSWKGHDFQASRFWLNKLETGSHVKGPCPQGRQAIRAMTEGDAASGDKFTMWGSLGCQSGLKHPVLPAKQGQEEHFFNSDSLWAVFRGASFQMLLEKGHWWLFMDAWWPHAADPSSSLLRAVHQEPFLAFSFFGSGR